MSLAVLPAMMFSLQVKFQSLYLLSFEGTRAISQDRNRCSFPSESDGKESAFSAGDVGSVPGSGRSPRGGHGNPLQHSCLETPTDRGAWQATARRVAKSQYDRSALAYTAKVQPDTKPQTCPNSFMAGHVMVHSQKCCLAKVGV